MNSELVAEMSVSEAIAGWMFMFVLLSGILIDLRLLTEFRKADPAEARTHRLGASPFQGIEVLHLAAIVILAESMIALGTKAVSRLGLAHEDTIHHTSLLLEGISLPIIVCASVAFMIKRRNATWSQAFTPQPLSAAQTIRAGLYGYLAMLPPAILLTWGFATLLQTLGIETDAQPVIDLLSDADQPLITRIYLTVAALLVAPILEELVFRGIALPALLKHTSYAFAIVSISALFALVHFHLPSTPALFVIAIACSLAYLKTGSIYVPMVMHAAFNGTTLVALFLQSR